jgi:hypothetical protein
MRKYMVRIIILFILIVGITIYWKYSYTYSDGYRAGLLQKFSRKGALFKTYEGEMILSSIQSNANVTLASEKFLFSVIDKNLANQLDRLQGESIVVHYEQKNSTLPWRGESEYIVDSVRVKTEIKAPPGPVK